MKDRREDDRMTMSMGPQMTPPTPERAAAAELMAAAMMVASVGLTSNAELVLQGVGLARKASAEGGAKMDLNFDDVSVAVTDLEAAALAYAEAKGYRKP